jgi:3-isopropylmalate/(R)-2-methylmalate dehydratase small subunit
MLKGTIYHVFGDNIDTDVIIAGRYLNIQNPQELSKHCFEDLLPDFPEKFEKGSIIIAGRNFGCGSSREAAPIAIKELGVLAIVAVSFARIFYRNAINIGLPIFECRDLPGRVGVGDELRIDLEGGWIENERTQEKFRTVPFPNYIRAVIESGGLINYGKAKLARRHSFEKCPE